MKILITGIGGFVGRHLVRSLLQQADTHVIGVVREHPHEYPALLEAGVDLYQLDLKDKQGVYRLCTELDPQHIYHLAAQSFIPQSFEDPWETLENNIQSQLNLLTFLADQQSEARILVVGSSAVYGQVKPEDSPIDEQQALRPNNPYSVSKVTQDLLALQYALSHKIQAIRVRPFNHAGPGQTDRFVIPAFASQIAAIEAGEQPPEISVGNLEAERDFTDVRDVVEAYIALMQTGQTGEVYNVGSGYCVSIQSILDSLLELSSEKIDVRIDAARFRPVDVKQIVCDNSKLKDATDWEPSIALQQTLKDVLQEWRKRLPQL